jgi:CheY-like chemotaxis protein
MPQDHSMPPLRVLYIEDDELVREITCELLADASLEVTAVATGEEALTCVNTRRFDIMVTDVSLPAMSGLELVRKVKAIDPSMPVILASGYPLDPDQCRLGSRVKAIMKPFSGSELDVLIQELCR